MTTSIRIDRSQKTITVSRSFLVAAGNISSPEYKEFLELRAKYPDFTIEAQEKGTRKSNCVLGKLTYADMTEFIKGHEPDTESSNKAMNEMNDLRALYKGQRGAYLKIREWFLEKYQDEVKRLEDKQKEEKRREREASFLYHPANA